MKIRPEPVALIHVGICKLSKYDSQKKTVKEPHTCVHIRILTYANVSKNNVENHSQHLKFILHFILS